jgi:hypothetical protein
MAEELGAASTLQKQPDLERAAPQCLVVPVEGQVARSVPARQNFKAVTVAGMAFMKALAAQPVLLEVVALVAQLAAKMVETGLPRKLTVVALGAVAVGATPEQVLGLVELVAEQPEAGAAPVAMVQAARAARAALGTASSLRISEGLIWSRLFHDSHSRVC